MRTTQQFSITLPNEMADIVKTKVAAGEYATESEVIRDGLRALMARDRRRDDVRPGLRITNYKKRAVIAFVVEAELVSIVGIYYGGQDYETVLHLGLDD